MADVEKYKNRLFPYGLVTIISSIALIINLAKAADHTKYLNPPKVDKNPIIKLGDGSLECLEKTATNDLKEDKTIFSRFVPPPKQTIIVYKRGTQTITATINYPAPADDAIDLMQKGDLKCRPHK